MNLSYVALRGDEARKFTAEIGSLRLRVFWEFPYLYEGSAEEEADYLETYFKAQHSCIFLVKDADMVVGATTGIWAQEEVESFKKPFLDHKLDPQNIFYFGESVLLPEYRGLGIGKYFFQAREEFARSLGFIKTFSFCAVKRPATHALRPKDHRDLDSFWASQGFKVEPGLEATYKWKDRDEKDPTNKQLQFWIKELP